MRLREDLADTREHLQAVIEELEASNEELQSVNEELQASSEELQASNEELQASNEELTTLNDELRIKSVEASQLSTTLGNIQNSIRMALIVVDQDLKVQSFNALAVRIFGLMPNDVGQSLLGVPCHLDLPNLRDKVSSVIRDGDVMVERVLEGEYCFVMQIAPYRDESDRISGALLTFTDTSELHRSEAARQSSETRFRHVWEASQEALLVVDFAGNIVLANPALERMFGYAGDALRGNRVEMLIPESSRDAHVRDREDFIRQPNQVRAMGAMRDVRGRRQDGSLFHVEVGLSSMAIDGANFVLASIIDISERRRLSLELDAHRHHLEEMVTQRTAALRAAQERLQLWETNVTDYAILTLDPAGSVISWSIGAERLKGYRADEIIGQNFSCFYSTDDIAPGSPPRCSRERDYPAVSRTKAGEFARTAPGSGPMS